MKLRAWPWCSVSIQFFQRKISSFQINLRFHYFGRHFMIILLGDNYPYIFDISAESGLSEQKSLVKRWWHSKMCISDWVLDSSFKEESHFIFSDTSYYKQFFNRTLRIALIGTTDQTYMESLKRGIKNFFLKKKKLSNVPSSSFSFPVLSQVIALASMVAVLFSQRQCLL